MQAPAGRRSADIGTGVDKSSAQAHVSASRLKKQTQKAKTPLEVAFWSALMLACGAAIALHADGVLSK